MWRLEYLEFDLRPGAPVFVLGLFRLVSQPLGEWLAPDLPGKEQCPRVVHAHSYSHMPVL